jgi:hypothetical protein
MSRSKFPPLFDQFTNWVVQGAKDLHNHIVPAFPQYVHGVDQPGTPQNLNVEPADASLSQANSRNFEQTLAAQKPAITPSQEPPAKGMEMGE